MVSQRAKSVLSYTPSYNPNTSKGYYLYSPWLTNMAATVSGLYSVEDPKACNLDSHTTTADPSQGHIFRLLELQPGSVDDPLVANLSTYETEKAPPYEAVSYVWGTLKSTQSLLCNQHRMVMTVNLEAALRRIRLTDKSRLIWVDAICINQGNDRERSHHVYFMKEVYLNAAQVLICMGEDSDGGAANVAALIDEHVQRMRMTGVNSVKEMPIISTDDAILSDPRWGSLAVLMRCEWFSRAWVLQEAGVAKKPRILYGRAEFSYSDLMKLTRWISRCAAPIQNTAGVDLLTIHTDWEDWSENWRASVDHKYTILDFLSHAKGLGCRDEQDHVYAFLGHPLLRLDNPSRPIITPDYENKTVGGLYTELTEWILAKEGLATLSAVEHDENTIIENIPSWVVRWNMDVIWNSMGYYPDFCYRVCGVDDPKVLTTPQGRALHVIALHLDTVVAKFDFAGSSDDWETTDARNFMRPANTIHEALSKLWQAVNSPDSPCRYSSEERLDALSLTLGAGLRNYECGETDLEQYRANFASFWKLRHEILARDPVPAHLEHLSTQGRANDFLFDLNLSCKGRAFFITKTGYYGLGPVVMKPGDECYILYGARVPFVLRPTGEHGPVRLMGEAYVHGIMHGELFTNSDVDRTWNNLEIG